jgi:hypothetical protein
MRAMAQPDPPKIFDFSLGGFSATELDRLEAYCDGLDRMRSALTGPEGYDFYNDSIRACHVAQVPQGAETVWIYERLAEIVRGLNNRSFRFDLRGFSEPPQYGLSRHGRQPFRLAYGHRFAAAQKIIVDATVERSHGL